MSVAAVLLAVAASLAVAVSGKTVEYMVPMRDGIELHTLVDFPPFEPEPILNKTVVIVRSPYGQNATELIADVYLPLGCIAVRQDIRGSHGSQGKFNLWRTEDLDVYDTLKWIGEQTWSNGRVFTVGASADGMATFTPMLLPPPELKGQFFIFSTANGYPIIYPGGAFREALALFWMQHTFPAQAPELIAEIKAEEAPGVWWNPLNCTDHFRNVSWPSVMYAGWYDIFLTGHLAAFEGFQKQSSLPGHSRIVVDPLGHCQGAAKYFPRNTILGRVALAFLLSFDLVEGKNTHVAENVSAVTFYVMGSDESDKTSGQFWVSVPDWPVPQLTPYYLNADRSLSTAPPANDDSSTAFIYDPYNPCPTVGGSNLELKCGPYDQSAIEKRSDVITFTTPALTEPLPLTGQIRVRLYVSSNCTDTDFTAKLTDVYPTGESRILNDGIVRMRWRNLANSNTEEPMIPGQVYEITISMWNVSYIFSTGHSVRVAISSSNFERFSVNPNNGVPLNVNDTMLIAENTFYHSAEYPSYLELPVVTMDQLPEFHVLDVMADAAKKSPAAAALLDAMESDGGEKFNRLLSLGGAVNFDE